MIKSKYIVTSLVMVSFVLLAIFAVSTNAYAEDSTAEVNNKTLLAQNFFEIRPVAELANNAVASLAGAKPVHERALFARQMRLNMDYAQLERKMTAALLDTYTVDEIKAMVDFYGSDLGKSITAKGAAFEQAVSPILQQMLDQAFVKANYGDNGAQSRP
jgi:hypothetical protein